MRRRWLLVLTLVISSTCEPARETSDPATDASLDAPTGVALASSTEGEGETKRVLGFEPGRAILSDVWGFDPFPVTKMEPLKDALEEGKISEETAVLLLDRGDTRSGSSSTTCSIALRGKYSRKILRRSSPSPNTPGSL